MMFGFKRQKLNYFWQRPSLRNEIFLKRIDLSENLFDKAVKDYRMKL